MVCRVSKAVSGTECGFIGQNKVYTIMDSIDNHAIMKLGTWEDKQLRLTEAMAIQRMLEETWILKEKRRAWNTLEYSDDKSSKRVNGHSL